MMRAIGNLRCELGEGVVWDEQRGCVWWVDIESRALHRCYPGSELITTLTFEQKIATVVPTTESTLVIGMEREIREISEDGRTLRSIPFEADMPYTRCNDGKAGPDGGLWIGSMSTRMQTGEASLYYMDRSWNLHLAATDITISNGLAWSADISTLYYIDTPTRQIDAFDYSPADGKISGRRCAVRVPGDLGYPDGMSIDSRGRLWVAMYGGECVTVWDPDSGELVERIPVPACRVTNLAFGGRDMKDVYITTGTDGADQQRFPDAGKLFHMRSNVAGTPGYFFGRSDS
ncbi:MAG: SMP-30/gluconolactonase/LRE family protein [Spirochaeta sp.]